MNSSNKYKEERLGKCSQDIQGVHLAGSFIYVNSIFSVPCVV